MTTHSASAAEVALPSDGSREVFKFEGPQLVPSSAEYASLPRFRTDSNPFDSATGRRTLPSVDLSDNTKRVAMPFELPEYRDKPATQQSDTIAGARKNLLTEMREHLDDRRYKRFEQMMTSFEQRIADRAYLQTVGGKSPADAERYRVQQITETYNQLTKLADTERGAREAFPQSKRVTLAEQFMFHAQDPSTMDQGVNGTCWIQAAHSLGLLKSPAQMARLLTDISLTSSFTTLNNGERDPRPRTVNFSRNLFNVGSRSPEANWTIDRYYGGSRSMIGKIFDEALPVIGGRAEGHSRGGIYPQSRYIMKMVTGEVVHSQSDLINGSARQTLLLDGGYMTWTRTHMRSMQLRKDGNAWTVLHDNQWGESSDQVLAKITNPETWSHGRIASNQAGRTPLIGGGDQPLGPLGPGNGGNSDWGGGRRVSYYRIDGGGSCRPVSYSIDAEGEDGDEWEDEDESDGGEGAGRGPLGRLKMRQKRRQKRRKKLAKALKAIARILG